MKRLIKHIEQLLYKEECVTIPGLGAFIRHDRSAVLDESRGLILPGKCDLSFNGQLSQNDGLVVQSYSQAYSFGYKRALALVESDVEELLSALRSRGIVQLGSIGKLTMERSEGRISFIPNPAHPFSIKYYGLMPVTQLAQLPVSGEEARGLRRRGDTVYLPINLRYARYTAAAAVIGAAIFLIPWGNLELPTRHTTTATPEHQASFARTAPVATPVELTNEEAPFEITAEEPVLDQEVEPAQPTLGGKPLLEAPLAQPSYLLVISSLSNEAEATKFLDENRAYTDFPDAGIYKTHSGRYRVFADAFDTMAEAQAALNDLVTKPGYATAWIHKAK
ncbi:MAG: SPOR domain-containing protein [Porphyromonas sp.]|nr:SPOR domain-containing protein [Porphyromonas sp.]